MNKYTNLKTIVEFTFRLAAILVIGTVVLYMFDNFIVSIWEIESQWPRRFVLFLLSILLYFIVLRRDYQWV